MKLFEKTKIGSLELKNRIVMPAMGTAFGNEMGFLTERLKAYLVERAKGGVGLIIVECTCIDSRGGKRFWRQLCIDSDKYIPALFELSEAVHEYGAKIALQLHHAGRLADIEVNEGIQPVSASSIPGYSGITGKEVLAKELSLEEIESIIEKFVNGVIRAREAGFDAVEFHGAHGFLIAQFLSPFTNHRTDLYGSDLKGRAKFALEIVRRSKEKVGRLFPLIFRISADEYLPRGLILEEAKIICQELEQVGIDALHISAGNGDESLWIKSGIMPAAAPPGCLVHFAEEVKKIVHVPVITVGRINDPVLAEKILCEGKADLVAMGRALLADPYLPQKALKERYKDICKCIGCCICPTFVLQKGGVKCTVNASLGKEKEERLLTFPKTRKILIVGGGPAGLEAARWAARRGHEVILYEKEIRLGGQVNIAARCPYKDEMSTVIRYLNDQIRKLEVRIFLGEEVTTDLIQKIAPEVVILATGVIPTLPEVKGANQRNWLTAWEFSTEKKELGQKGLILGGSSVGLEIAEFLLDQGKELNVIEEGEEIAPKMESRTRHLLDKRLAKKGVKIFRSTKIKELRDERTYLLVDREGKEFEIDVDFAVSAFPPLPNQRLENEIQSTDWGRDIEIHSIGDCLKPRSLLAAIHDGYRVGREV